MKNLSTLLSLAFFAFLILYSQFFDYSNILNGFNTSNEEMYYLFLSILILVVSFFIYGEIIQKLTTKAFHKLRYFIYPLLYALSLTLIINAIYFFNDEEVFCFWVCGTGYNWKRDFTVVLFFYGSIGFVYGFIRLALQQKFFHFFQQKYLRFSDVLYKKGRLITSTIWIINLFLLSAIVYDHASYGEKLHLSNDSGFYYYWKNKALKNNNLQMCEILNNDEKLCEGTIKNGKSKMVCGHRNICISQVLTKRNKTTPVKLQDCDLLKNNAKSFCKTYF